MEARLVLSLAGGGQPLLSAVAHPDFERVVFSPSGATFSIVGSDVPVSPDSGSASPVGYTPSEIRAAYGVNGITFGSIAGDGTGQTIAIVDAFDNPSLVGTNAPNFATSDLGEFDSAFGLPAPPSFTKLNETGGTSGLPSTDPSGDWETEEALDVEWAHAVAPAAGIVLIECSSSNQGDMYQGVMTAAALPGVSVVSMSWGANEFAGETSLDKTFTTPSGHDGVTFVGATGDAGSPGDYPAFSPNVVAVGGTTLTIGANGSYVGESAWSSGGGGTSNQESEPAFQDSVQSTGWRETPDVSFDANPSTGVAVYDSYSGGSATPWQRIGGTSLATPCWAALFAIADQGRVLRGGSPLDGPTQTLPALYALPSSDFRDITTGSNGFPAGPGYDEATGIGTPIANLLVPDLASYGLTDTLVVTSEPISPITAGSPFSLAVSVESSGGSVDSTAEGSISLSIAAGPASATLLGPTSATIENGVVIFSGLVLTTAAADYTLAASITGMSSVVTRNFSVAPAAAEQLAINSSPATATAGTPFSVSVAVEDQYGNLVTGSGASVSLELAGGPAGVQLGGITSVPASGGVATFSTVFLTEAASGYRLEAIVTGLSSASTASFSVAPGAADRLAIGSCPSSVIAGTAFDLSVLVEDEYGNQVTTGGTNITLGLASGPANEIPAVSTSAPDASGVAGFSSLILKTAGSYQIAAVAAGLISTTTNTITIAPAAAYELAIGAQPSSVAAGVPFDLSVLVEDEYGNEVTTGGTSITLNLFGGPSSQSAAASASALDTGGLANFSDLSFTTAASNYAIEASAAGLIPAITGTFTVTFAAASQLVIIAAPPALGVAGVPFGTTVTIEDRYGNVVTDADLQVSLALASGPAAASVGGASSLPAAGGVVVFAQLSVTTAANDYRIEADASGLAPALSPDFQIAAGNATHLAVTAAPPSDVAAGQSFGLGVAAEDRYGNLASTFTAPIAVSLAGGAGGALSVATDTTLSAGSASFSGLALDTVGSGITLQVTSPGLPALVTGPLAVVPAAPARLVIVSAFPSLVTAGVPLSLTIDALDRFGNLETSFSGLAGVGLASGPTGASLAGSVATDLNGGVASFFNLVIDRAGAGYALRATTGQLSTTPSSAFSVSPGAAAKAVIASGPPARARVGQPFGLTLVVLDQYGNEATSFDGVVSTALAPAKARAKLTGTRAVSASQGVASFTNLIVKKTGRSFALAVTPSGFPTLTTTPFNVTKAPPKRSALHSFARLSLRRRLRS
jgi:hypothetical protein